MFKVGDRVRKKNGGVFSNGDHVLTVSRVDCGRVSFKETKSWLLDLDVEIDIPSPSPVRTVTRREIVPGTYGRVYVSGTYKGEHVTLDWTENGSIHTAVPIVGLSASELREAAHLFNQLAEALEDKP